MKVTSEGMIDIKLDIKLVSMNASNGVPYPHEINYLLDGNKSPYAGGGARGGAEGVEGLICIEGGWDAGEDNTTCVGNGSSITAALVRVTTPSSW